MTHRTAFLLPLAAGLLGGALLGAAPAHAFTPPDRPLIIAHRGASQYLPEHTMAAYRMAIGMGADFIEPDLMLTVDGVLVARHDRALAATTDIASHAERLGGRHEVDRLTFAEIATLTATSRGGPAYAPPGASAEPLRVPAFREVLDELHRLYRETGRVVGVYPEVKAIGEGLTEHNRAAAEALLAALADPRYEGLFDGRRGNVILQSFDAEVIRHLAARTSLPLVHLTGRCPEAPQAQAIARHADGVGITVAQATPECLARLREAGLLVHVYTLSNVDPALHATMLSRGVDGLFTNTPDVGIATRRSLGLERQPAPLPARRRGS